MVGASKPPRFRGSGSSNDGKNGKRQGGFGSFAGAHGSLSTKAKRKVKSRERVRKRAIMAGAGVASALGVMAVGGLGLSLLFPGGQEQDPGGGGAVSRGLEAFAFEAMLAGDHLYGGTRLSRSRNSGRGAARGLLRCHSSQGSETGWTSPHPAGAGLLQTFSASHNTSLLWGTYRPSVYYGFKTRTSPDYIGGGLLWHREQARGGSRKGPWRHDAQEGDGLQRYGWHEHDGRSYGNQTISDHENGMEITTVVVKPKNLQTVPVSAEGFAFASRIQASPVGTEDEGSEKDRVGSLYLYFGIDCDGEAGQAGRGCLSLATGGGAARGLRVDMAGPRDCDVCTGPHGEGKGDGEKEEKECPGAHRIRATAHTASLGTHSLHLSATSGAAMEEREGEGRRRGLEVRYEGVADVLFADMDKLLREREQKKRRSPKRGAGGTQSEEGQEQEHQLLSNSVADRSNVVVIQVTGVMPFSIDFAISRHSKGEEDEGGGEEKEEELLLADRVQQWTAQAEEEYSQRFEATFGLERKGVAPEDIAAAKAAIGNMLGGVGYFHGQSKLTGSSGEGQQASSFRASLFSCVPSRSFFPRGFLWDEGFHQLLVTQWDSGITMDVLGHWLGLLHRHTPPSSSSSNEEEEEGEEEGGCAGGWIPREQILGEVARRRVPAEFVAQNPKVANPPTLLLLVESLLDAHPSLERGDTQQDGGVEEGSHVHGDEEQQQQRESAEKIRAFLRAAAPALSEWVQWLILTQQPESAATGEGGGPFGGFLWRGRDPQDDRLNALTLSSGLDDYPRAHFPTEEERNVDLLCWVVLSCKVMARLQRALEEGEESGEVGGDEAGGGVGGGGGGAGGKYPDFGAMASEATALLDRVHWSDEHQAYLDVGRDFSSPAAVVSEVVVACGKAEEQQGGGRRGGGSTVQIGVPIEDLQRQRVRCPADHPRFLYPLGDGRGGLSTRERWHLTQQQQSNHGSSDERDFELSSVQHIAHVGYVSLFPLLLKVLPVDHPRLPLLLRDLRDPAKLWSPYGLRSLSRGDAYYQKANNPGDEPYWRGFIWININYLACAALHHYTEAATASGSPLGHLAQDFSQAYSELRHNILSTVLKEYHRTGFFWEQYSDSTGRGQRSHPFTGWTALFVNILAERY